MADVMQDTEFKKRMETTHSMMVNLESIIDESIEAIKSLGINFDIPKLSETFDIKINELYETFEKDGKPLSNHLAVIYGSKYMINKCIELISHVEEYFKSIYRAVDDDNAELVTSLLGLQEDVEEEWSNRNNDLLQFDYRKGIDKLLEGDPVLPPGLTKENVHDICDFELYSAHYSPRNYSKGSSK